MIKFSNIYLSKREQLVVDKYGEEHLEDVINDAQTDFWITIHDKLVMTESDESTIDIDDEIAYAVLEYIYANDAQLQEQWEKRFD